MSATTTIPSMEIQQTAEGGGTLSQDPDMGVRLLLSEARPTLE